MTKEQISSWLRQIATMLETVNSITNAIDTLTGQHHVSVAVNNHKQTADLITERDRLIRDREAILADLLYRCNATDVAGVETRIVDINIRLENVDKLFESWRRKLASYEHLASIENGFAEEPNGQLPTRAEFDAELTRAKNAYQVALQNVDALVPNKAVLIG